MYISCLFYGKMKHKHTTNYFKKLLQDGIRSNNIIDIKHYT